MPLRAGRFRASLSPYGTGSLSLDDVYSVSQPSGSGPPVPAQPPPRDTTPGAGAGSAGSVKPAKIGKTPNPKTTPARKAPVRRPAPVAAKAKPVAAKAKAIPARKATPRPTPVPKIPPKSLPGGGGGVLKR